MDTFDEMLKNNVKSLVDCGTCKVPNVVKSVSSFLADVRPDNVGNLASMNTNIVDSVVIGETTELNLRLYGAIANGNAIIQFSNGKGLKFTRGKDFKLKTGKTAYQVTMQILEAGCGSNIKSQSWNRPKTVTKTIIKEKEVQAGVDVKRSTKKAGF